MLLSFVALFVFCVRQAASTASWTAEWWFRICVAKKQVELNLIHPVFTARDRGKPRGTSCHGSRSAEGKNRKDCYWCWWWWCTDTWTRDVSMEKHSVGLQTRMETGSDDSNRFLRPTRSTCLWLRFGKNWETFQ
jgi:hypothetical protein